MNPKKDPEALHKEKEKRQAMLANRRVLAKLPIKGGADVVDYTRWIEQIERLLDGPDYKYPTPDDFTTRSRTWLTSVGANWSIFL